METKSQERTTEKETSRRTGPDLAPEEFRRLGHALVDRLASHMARMPDGPGKPDEAGGGGGGGLTAGRRLPETGADAGALLDTAASLLFEHSVFNGHP